ncbi:hypothetical protein PybrP1_001011 [[Pythium] brassicae (nom. inval.)]|nr:hypothetical protein PybrP1_001011 [[Pythium] brassicae (nom. inval.)]
MAAYVHVGQCGNQLGAAYWQLVGSSDDEASASQAPTKPQPSSVRKRLPPSSASSKQAAVLAAQISRHFFLRPAAAAAAAAAAPLKARCVLVDTEPKVVASVLSRGDFQPAFAHVEQSGRGNNWAMGYNFQHFRRNVIPSKSHTAAAAGPASSMGGPNQPRRPQAVGARTPFDGDDRRELVERAMDSLQKLIEATDCFQGTVLMHSLGGGTGAGLGSRLVELVRDAYPRSYLLTISVAPSGACGDTPLQNYNALFTLAHLQEHADCVLYKENDELLRVAGLWKTLRAKQQDASTQQHTTTDSHNGSKDATAAQPRVSISELNHLAAADVAGLLFPTVSSCSNALSAPVVQPFAFGSLVHDLCPLPAAKFLDVRTGVLRATQLRPSSAKAVDPLFHAGACHVPLAARKSSSNVHSDDSEVEALANKLFRHTAQSFPRSSDAALACSAQVRGFTFANESSTVRSLQVAADAAFPAVAWYPDRQAAVATTSLAPFAHLGGKASVTICANNGHVLRSVEQFLPRAQRQFHAGAYVHWYKQHGLEESHFHEAFECCQGLADGYKELLN